MNQLNCLPQEAVIWGHGVLSSAAESLARYGVNHPITFTVDPLQQLNRTWLEPHIKQSVGSFTDLPAHAPDTAVRNALAACMNAGADSIVALGGGSVLDAAKAVSYLHHQETGRFLPIAAFPTTLSGSEFSHYFGI